MNESLQYRREFGLTIGHEVPVFSHVSDCANGLFSNQSTTPLKDVLSTCKQPGFAIGLAVTVFEYLKIPIEKLDVLAYYGHGTLVNGSSTDLIDGISSGETDISWPTVSITRERKELVDFSDPVFSIPIGFLTR